MRSDPLKIHPLILSMSLLYTPAMMAQSNEIRTEKIYVYGEQGKTDTATKLELTILETPQTVTTISQAQLEDFSLTSINDVLDYTPGVTVEEIETDRTYYTARGFDIVNFQYDGVGVPFVSGLNLGQQNTAIYEKVEVVKGASGLITGLANPSATINYVRKRPTDALKASASLNIDELKGGKLDGDVSGMLSPKIRSRAVLSYSDGESYIDRHHENTRLAYGVMEFDLSESTLFTVGHSYDASYSQGALWGALPLLYSNGAQTNYDVSTSTAPSWTFADNIQNQTFAELKSELGINWSFNAIATHNKSTYESELFYVYGTPDAETEIGLNGWASEYHRLEKQNNIDIFFSGRYLLAGREHQLVAGYSYSKTQLNESSHSDQDNGFPALDHDWAQGNTAPLNFTSHDPNTQTSDVDLTQKAFYLASRLDISNNLSILLGARNTKLEQSGNSYGGEAAAYAKETVPYFGLTYTLLDTVMLYSSYSEVFKQQTWVNADLKPLGATLGKSSEAGIKKSLNNERATFTFSIFSSDQSNYGDFIERAGDIAIYEGITLKSKGYEIEFSGELFTGLNVGAGYTRLNIEKLNTEDKNDIKVSRFIPSRHSIPSQLLKLSAAYDIPTADGFKLGSVLKWQNTITTEDKQVKQGAYPLIDLALHYQALEDMTLSLNIENITNKKYYNSLYWSQAYFGAPRTVSTTLRWNF